VGSRAGDGPTQTLRVALRPKLNGCVAPTKFYIARKIAEDKTKREAARCLKRHLIRTV
jgi:hypothetical protein